MTVWNESRPVSMKDSPRSARAGVRSRVRARLRGPVGRGLVFASLLATLIGATGCGSALFGGNPVKAEPLLLVGACADTAVNMGDPLVVEAVLISQYKKPLVLPSLSASSLEFWLTDGAGRTYKRDPVVSPLENLRDSMPLGPGERWRRRFVLTQGTETSGTLRVQLMYGTALSAEGLLPDGVVTSDPLGVTVRGTRTLHRDSAGVLLRADAVDLARAWAGIPDARVSATLVRNEAGFLDWWVRLGAPGQSGYSKACLINPYMGTFHAEVDPGKVPPASVEPEIKAPPPQALPQPLRDTEK